MSSLLLIPLPMNAHDRTEAFTRLFRTFEELLEPFRRPPPRQMTESMRRLVSGETSPDRYFEAEIEAALDGLSPFLDGDDINDVRKACHEYLEEALLHSDSFTRQGALLPQAHLPSHAENGAIPMSQRGRQARSAEGAQGSEDLQKLKRGEISLDDYMELRLAKQLDELQLKRMLSPEETNELRTIMRENFLNSPLFRHYAQFAAGKTGDDQE